jgi:hypothetical protein
MTKSLPTQLERLGTRLREHVVEVANLRLVLDIQSRRIAGSEAQGELPSESQHASSAVPRTPDRKPSPMATARK